MGWLSNLTERGRGLWRAALRVGRRQPRLPAPPEVAAAAETGEAKPAAPPKSPKSRALDYHAFPVPGKIGTQILKPAQTADDLSLAYSPGVASPCLEIEKDAARAYDYTSKGNLVAVITNGTAVLGLGDIGALAAKPVMEGKAMLFKKFADINAVDIEIDAPSPEVFIETVANISPSFGAINLEDIRAPECFFIEHRLRRRLSIPLMHDDQHGTAVVTCAALHNALLLQNKKAENIRILVLGAGAAAIAITRMMMSFFGLKKRQILMYDSKGILSTEREEQIESYKMSFVRDTRIKTLEAGVRSADVVIGVARGDLVTPEMVRGMREKPIILAMSNPVPEIMPAAVAAVRDDAIVATGRSDLPNQVNNSVCFPYLFRAVLDLRAKSFNNIMFFAAVTAIADLARESAPADLRAALGSSAAGGGATMSGVAAGGELEELEFGPKYILPKQFDPRLRERVVPAVVRAVRERAKQKGGARRASDWGSSYEAEGA